MSPQTLLLINPNSSEQTTRMMVGIAESAAPTGFRVVGVTAARGPRMIVSADELALAADEVCRLWDAHREGVAAVIVAAFADPGLATLRGLTALPSAGLCEAALLEAGEGGRRFGIATTTPGLADVIAGTVTRLGLGGAWCGMRVTAGDPAALVGDPERLVQELRRASLACVEEDGAEAVIIGGGPLGQVAASLAPGFPVPLIEPIPAAVRSVLVKLRCNRP